MQLDATQQHKCNIIRQKAIGKPLTVRLDKSTTVRGVIQDVTPLEWRDRGRSRVMIFAVVMACGENKTLRTFNLEKLPQ